MIRVLMAIVLLAVLHLFSSTSLAQDSPDGTQPVPAAFEAGAIVGTFSGISLKYHPRARLSWDFHTSFNAEGFWGIRVHGLKESVVETSPLTFFIGPGVTAGISDSEVFLGPAAETGVFFGIERYRVVLQLMPEIEVIPRLEGRLLAGVGLRITI